MSKEIKIIEDPWKDEGPRRVLNSKWSFKESVLKKIENFDGINQNEGAIKIKIKKTLVQLSER